MSTVHCVCTDGRRAAACVGVCVLSRAVVPAVAMCARLLNAFRLRHIAEVAALSELWDKVREPPGLLSNAARAVPLSTGVLGNGTAHAWALPQVCCDMFVRVRRALRRSCVVLRACECVRACFRTCAPRV